MFLRKLDDTTIWPDCKIKIRIWPITANPFTHNSKETPSLLMEFHCFCETRQTASIVQAGVKQHSVFLQSSCGQCIKIDQILQECRMERLTPFCLQLQASLNGSPHWTGSDVILLTALNVTHFLLSLLLFSSSWPVLTCWHDDHSGFE